MWNMVPKTKWVQPQLLDLLYLEGSVVIQKYIYSNAMEMFLFFAKLFLLELTFCRNRSLLFFLAVFKIDL